MRIDEREGLEAARARLVEMLAPRLGERARAFLEEAAAELHAGVDDTRFAALISLASRHARSRPLAPTPEEIARAAETVPDWSPELWTLLDALRAALVLSRPDLAEESGARAILEAFRFADVGELTALYRTLALLPGPERFVWRAGEGCRSNIRDVFVAVACDSPYPVRYLDDVAWRQLVIKALFIEAPLWRVRGLDARLDPELARMALDLADERRSAGRPVRHELWLALGPHGGERARASLLAELDPKNPHTLGRAAAAYGLARAGERETLERLAAGETESRVAAAMADALAGNTAQTVFRALDPSLEEQP